MSPFQFKKSKSEGLHSYLHIGHTGILDKLNDNKSLEIVYKQHFHDTVGLAQFVTEHLTRYVLVRKNPSLKSIPFLSQSVISEWKYLLLSSDEHGLGIDHGFCSADLLKENRNQLFGIDSLLDICDLPEDTFGDTYSRITVFGIGDNRTRALEEFLRSTRRPHLYHFLKDDEIFFHFKLSKRKWGHDAILIKSRQDIETKLFAYQTIINPNN